MKGLIQYIKKMLSTKKVEEAPKEEKLTLVQHCGTPDEIIIPYSDGYVNYGWHQRDAHAFLYNTEIDDIIWNDSKCKSHNNLIGVNSDYIIKNWNIEDPKTLITKKVSEIKNNIIYGRVFNNLEHHVVWVDAYEKFDIEPFPKDETDMTCLTFWNAIEPDVFKKTCDRIISDYNKQFSKNIERYYVIDNNGAILHLEKNKKPDVEIKSRTADSEEYFRHAAELHFKTDADSRRKKRERNAGYIRARDEHFQKERYDKTASKTAAEWHNNKTLHYNKYTGKMEWGEKIGDSLVMKHLTDYINEELN